MLLISHSSTSSNLQGVINKKRRYPLQDIDDKVEPIITVSMKRRENAERRTTKTTNARRSFSRRWAVMVVIYFFSFTEFVDGSTPWWQTTTKNNKSEFPMFLSAALFRRRDDDPSSSSSSSSSAVVRPKDNSSLNDYRDDVRKIQQQSRDRKLQQQQESPGIYLESSRHNKDNDDNGPSSLSFSISPVALFRNLRRNWTHHRPDWLKLPPPDVVDRLAGITRCVALVILAYEISVIVRDLVKEALNEMDMGDQDSVPAPLLGSSSQSLISPKVARKLTTWLEEGRGKGEPPPNVSPSWLVTVAQNLHACRNLPSKELERILCQLTRFEASLLETCLLRPDSHSDTFESVGGLFGAKATICQWLSSFTLPPVSSTAAAATKNAKEISVPHYSQHVTQQSQSPYSKLLQRDSPSGKDKLNGLILWGPPGCGKSLLIRAISNQAGLPTLVITPSLLQRKWYGESTNRVRALFGLIDKLGSVCVVLDEVDGLLRARREEDHEVSRELKTEWLQWWDGVASSLSMSSLDTTNRKCLVVAATNHPWDVDIAAWRRFQHRVFVGLPNSQDRTDLLKKWTDGLPSIEPIVVQYVVSVTEGYSPSDLFTFLQSAVRSGPLLRDGDDDRLNIGDFHPILSQFKPTQLAPQYVQKLQNFNTAHNTHGTQWVQSSSSPSLPSSSSPMPGGSSTDSPEYCWNTPWGNYYKISVPVDSEVIDAIDRMLWTWNDWDEDGDDYDNYLDDTDDDFFDDTTDDFDFDNEDL